MKTSWRMSHNFRYQMDKERRQWSIRCAKFTKNSFLKIYFFTRSLPLKPLMKKWVYFYKEFTKTARETCKFQAGLNSQGCPMLNLLEPISALRRAMVQGFYRWRSGSQYKTETICQAQTFTQGPFKILIRRFIRLLSTLLREKRPESSVEIRFRACLTVQISWVVSKITQKGLNIREGAQFLSFWRGRRFQTRRSRRPIMFQR